VNPDGSSPPATSRRWRRPWTRGRSVPEQRSLVEVDIDASRVRQLLMAAGVRIEPLLAEDAELAGAI